MPRCKLLSSLTLIVSLRSITSQPSEFLYNVEQQRAPGWTGYALVHSDSISSPFEAPSRLFDDQTISESSITASSDIQFVPVFQLGNSIYDQQYVAVSRPNPEALPFVPIGSSTVSFPLTSAGASSNSADQISSPQFPRYDNLQQRASPTDIMTNSGAMRAYGQPLATLQPTTTNLSSRVQPIETSENYRTQTNFAIFESSPFRVNSTSSNFNQHTVLEEAANSETAVAPGIGTSNVTQHRIHQQEILSQRQRVNQLGGSGSSRQIPITENQSRLEYNEALYQSTRFPPSSMQGTLAHTAGNQLEMQNITSRAIPVYAANQNLAPISNAATLQNSAIPNNERAFQVPGLNNNNGILQEALGSLLNLPLSAPLTRQSQLDLQRLPSMTGATASMNVPQQQRDSNSELVISTTSLPYQSASSATLRESTPVTTLNELAYPLVSSINVAQQQQEAPHFVVSPNMLTRANQLTRQPPFTLSGDSSLPLTSVYQQEGYSSQLPARIPPREEQLQLANVPQYQNLSQPYGSNPMQLLDGGLGTILPENPLPRVYPLLNGIPGSYQIYHPPSAETLQRRQQLLAVQLNTTASSVSGSNLNDPNIGLNVSPRPETTTFQSASSTLSGTQQSENVQYSNSSISRNSDNTAANKSLQVNQTPNVNAKTVLPQSSLKPVTLSLRTAEVSGIEQRTSLLPTMRLETPEAGCKAVRSVGYAEEHLCCSLKSGYWSSSQTWSCGRIPTASDAVVVLHSIELVRLSTRREDTAPLNTKISIKALWILSSKSSPRAVLRAGLPLWSVCRGQLKLTADHERRYKFPWRQINETVHEVFAGVLEHTGSLRAACQDLVGPVLRYSTGDVILGSEFEKLVTLSHADIGIGPHGLFVNDRAAFLLFEGFTVRMNQKAKLENNGTMFIGPRFSCSDYETTKCALPSLSLQPGVDVSAWRTISVHRLEMLTDHATNAPGSSWAGAIGYPSPLPESSRSTLSFAAGKYLLRQLYAGFSLAFKRLELPPGGSAKISFTSSNEVPSGEDQQTQSNILTIFTDEVSAGKLGEGNSSFILSEGNLKVARYEAAELQINGHSQIDFVANTIALDRRIKQKLLQGTKDSGILHLLCAQACDFGNKLFFANREN